jgi:16S rRNA processing protein RimM
VKKDLVTIGRVSKPHGVKGEIRIEYFNPGLHFFFHYDTLFLGFAQDDLIAYRCINSRMHKQSVLCFLEGVSTRDDAERLRGAWVMVEYDTLPPREEGEYYWHDILGMRVETKDGEYVGKVVQILATGSNDVYVVRREGEEFLIPALEGVVLKIEESTNTMIVVPLHGLGDDDDL